MIRPGTCEAMVGLLLSICQWVEAGLWTVLALLKFESFGLILATYQRKAPIDLLTCLQHRWSVPCMGCSVCRSWRWEHDSVPIRPQLWWICLVCCCPSCPMLCPWPRENHLINRHKYPLCFDWFGPILATWEGSRSSPDLYSFFPSSHA